MLKYITPSPLFGQVLIPCNPQTSGTRNPSLHPATHLSRSNKLANISPPSWPSLSMLIMGHFDLRKCRPNGCPCGHYTLYLACGHLDGMPKPFKCGKTRAQDSRNIIFCHRPALLSTFTTSPSAAVVTTAKVHCIRRMNRMKLGFKLQD
jgi:hypothetical protein